MRIKKEPPLELEPPRTATENLTSNIISCCKKGCKRKMSALKDLTGQRFGRLTVIARAGSDAQSKATWCCLCDCGRKVVVTGTKLRRNNTRSCGCLKGEVARKRLVIHGKTNTRLFPIWQSMKDRCHCPSHHAYKHYGARGIFVCDEWRYDFMKFYEWAMENGYDENAPIGKCTIDRIDNDKGYSPDNCRWVDMKVQNNNKRRIIND